MPNHPPASELASVVAELLKTEIMPMLDGRSAFHTRIAVNVLGIVERDIAKRSGADERERQRLQSLMDSDQKELDALNKMLCDAIAAGSVPNDDTGLIQHLWATTLDAMAIDQPDYETFRRARLAADGSQTKLDGE